MIAATFQSLLQGFFTDRLLRQRQASPHTIAGYRDTFACSSGLRPTSWAKLHRP